MQPRMTEIGWVTEHLEDLEADFLVFYRIDDIYTVSAPKFMSLATRVFAYAGVMQARATEEQQNGTSKNTRHRSPQSSRKKADKTVEATKGQLAMAPEMQGLFE